MPKGFCNVGDISNNLTNEKRTHNIRLYSNPEDVYPYDRLNVPVWVMEHEGYLFIRGLSPRINMTFIDIVKDGKIKDICPNATDVSEFIDEID